MFGYTQLCALMLGLFLLMFGAGNYFMIAGDDQAGRAWAHVSILFAYAGILWEVAVRLHRSCPLRRWCQSSRGPTTL